MNVAASIWATLAAGLLSGSFLPWTLRLVLRFIRGDVERAEHRADVESKREAAELERLVAEISRLTARHGDLEELVDLLRRELDKALVRGNASLTIARILTFAVDQEPKPSLAMIAAREQARKVIDAADEQMKRGN